MNLYDISFPIYKLGRRKPIIEEGVACYLNRTEIDGTLVYLVQIIDDKNQPGNSLALRRLRIKERGDRLFKLKYAIFFISDMLKLTKGATWFVDSNGKIFEYAKSKRVPLVFKKIKQVIPIKTGGAIIEVENIPYRFKTLYAPQLEHKYAGVLDIGGGYILYGLYTQKYDNTIRMI